MHRRQGVTLTETLVVLGIIVVLGAITFRLSSPARAAAKEGVCAERLRQMHVGATLYQGDAGGESEFPDLLPGGTLRPYHDLTLVQPYLKVGREYFTCPATPPCARDKWWGTYIPTIEFPVPNPTPYDIGGLERQRERMKKLGGASPMIVCQIHESHRRLANPPRSRLVKPSFVIELVHSGAIRTGPRDYAHDLAQMLCEKKP